MLSLWQNGGGAQLYSDSLLERHTIVKNEKLQPSQSAGGISHSQWKCQPASEREKRKKGKKQVARKDELRREKKRREVLARCEIISLLGERRRAPLDKLIFSVCPPLHSCNASSITNQSMVTLFLAPVCGVNTLGKSRKRAQAEARARTRGARSPRQPRLIINF